MSFCFYFGLLRDLHVLTMVAKTAGRKIVTLRQQISY